MLYGKFGGGKPPPKLIKWLRLSLTHFSLETLKRVTGKLQTHSPDQAPQNAASDRISTVYKFSRNI